MKGPTYPPPVPTLVERDLSYRTIGLAFIALCVAGCEQQKQPARIASHAPHPLVNIDWTAIVFFEFDSAQLTDRARRSIAWDVKMGHYNVHFPGYVVQVTGFTDWSGSPAYNQRLSLRRAQSVAAELERDGVARGDIIIRGLGDRLPLVPTPPGRQEPQNRRVEFPLVSRNAVTDEAGPRGVLPHNRRQATRGRVGCTQPTQRHPT